MTRASAWRKVKTYSTPHRRGEGYKFIREMFKRNNWKIFPGDTVYVRTGPDRGESGKVLAVNRDKKCPEVIVEGINMRKKFVSSRDPDEEGGGQNRHSVLFGTEDQDKSYAVTMEAPIHYSAVGILDPKTKRCVGIAFRYLEDGTRVRITAGRGASGAILPIPVEENKLPELTGTKDTTKDEVLRATYDPLSPFPFHIPKIPRPPPAAFYSTAAAPKSAAAVSNMRSLLALGGFTASGLLCGRTSGLWI